MNDDILTIGKRRVRYTDSNSLLRMLDRVNELLAKSSSAQLRAKAERAIRVVTAELHKRTVPL